QISKKGIATVDTRLKRKDGKIIDVLVSSTPLDPSNLSAGVTFTALDITERKRAERGLRTERERFRSLSENAPFGMMMISKDGTFRHVNPKFHEIFGYDLSDIPNGKTWFRKAFPDGAYRHQVIASWIEDLASSEVGENRPRVFSVTCKDGSRKIANFISVQMETGENLTACEDITERRHAEAALRESEKRFRELFNSISDLVYTQDLDGRLLSVNPALCTAFGYSEVELVGRRVSDFLKPELADAFERDYLERLRKDGHQQGTSVYLTKQGEEIYIEYRSSMVYPESGEPYISGTGRDVTARVLAEREKRKLQAELNQAQKMEAVGTLAGGIAHNFNNILMGVQGRTSLMLMDKDPAHPDYEHLKGIEEYVRNAVELTKDLLGFARGGKYEVK
ncbi:MAG: PAS domain S-box protein, partial [Deltaproteobacteria bacterium]